MLIDQLMSDGPLPVLEASAQFAARRHELIAHNIANASTPNFRPHDVSPGAFQRALGRAVDARRSAEPGLTRGSGLGAVDEGPVRWGSDGRLTLHPSPVGGGILFHDRNDRSLERLMQDLVQNTGAFRLATDLFKSRLGLMDAAMRERL